MTWQELFKRLLKNKLSLFGLIIIVFFALIAIFAPFIAPPADPDDPYAIPRSGWIMEPTPPDEDNIFGTTEGSYDIFYGMIWGTRTAFRIGFIVVGISTIIGVIIGTISAYYGGWVDEIVMRITDIFMSIPFLVSALVLTAILGKGLDNVMIALIVFGWMGTARLMRSQVLEIKAEEFVQAASALGAGDLRIIFRHVLLNCIFPVVIQASMRMGSMVITAATLSFLGVGAPPGYADWGQMISFARNWIIGAQGNALSYWYTLVIPGTAITLFCLSWNLIGDAFRDILDPKLQN
ncbi:ABC transporter permease [Halothermothrix orenii]|uniref:Binding-protein-dependent transport systems inner membrane component n=1 Tax=Halothermothrix orenii (strain H 168 / OCM 544 / DSM 9562) TaxID=373903 RepID=B8D223_HALOH|nr:ABC transporter permease [Halothermothrix orenii]ACL69250.1 binding-protein-dependent transport systems inner membrane component [Halothermothrix orenii H 168]